MIRKFQAAFGLLVGAGVLAATVACGSYQSMPDGPEYVGVCVDPHTGVRVPDNYCGGANALGAAIVAAYTWDYIDTWRYPTYVMPSYGSRINVTNITVIHQLPAGVSSSRSVPRTGGSTSSIRSSLAKSGNFTKSSSSSGTGSKSSPGISRGGFGVPGARSGSGSSSSGGSRSYGGSSRGR